MGDKTWKAVERRLAARLGGQRTGPTGRTGPDVVSDWCSVEVKTRKALPRWLVDAVHQAVGAAAPGTLPVVVLHQVGERHDDDLAVMTLADFEQWHGPLQTELGNDPDAPGEPIPQPADRSKAVTLCSDTR